jgi:hypothetical protein
VPAWAELEALAGLLALVALLGFLLWQARWRVDSEPVPRDLPEAQLALVRVGVVRLMVLWPVLELSALAAQVGVGPCNCHCNGPE